MTRLKVLPRTHPRYFRVSMPTPCSTFIWSWNFGLNIPARYMNFVPASEDQTMCFGGIRWSEGLGEKTALGNVMNKALFSVLD